MTDQVMLCKLCGTPIRAWDDLGRWAGEPAHATPCVSAAREALEAIARNEEQEEHKARAAAARRLLRRVA